MAVMARLTPQNRLNTSGSEWGASEAAAEYPTTMPSSKGVKIEARATASTPRRLWPCCSRLNPKSMPIWNMRNTNPSWLMTLMVEGTAPNSTPDRCGKKCPNSEGPSRRPAMISPTTPGWPRRRATVLSTRAARIITISCSRIENSRSSVWLAESKTATLPCDGAVSHTRRGLGHHALDAVAARFLRLIQRLVGTRQRGTQVLARPVNGKPAGHGELDVSALHLQRGARHLAADAFDADMGAVQVSLRHHQHELLAAVAAEVLVAPMTGVRSVASHPVQGADLAQHQHRELTQHVVAGEMAVAVVDGLEVVQVHQAQ